MALSISPNSGVAYNICYEDDDLLVVEKPAGVVSQPGKGHQSDSLLNGLFARFGGRLQALGPVRDWGLMHRLDRDTSGLLIVALTPAAHAVLREAFERRRVRKAYWAIVFGRPARAGGVIQQPIREVQGVQKRGVIHRDGRPATTSYRVLDSVALAAAAGRNEAGWVSLIEARPATGRLHQVRVHLAHLGCPILGDEMYGGVDRAMPRVPRLCLHAAELSFVHPTTQRRVEVRSPWPADLKRVLARLGLRERHE